MILKLLNRHLINGIILKRGMSSEYSACFTTVSKDDVARKLARSIVESQLGACVNIIPNIRSIYQWQSKIEEDEEYLLIIKTKKELVPELIDFVKKNHPYQVPELIQLPIENGNIDYLKWIDSVVKQKTNN